MTNHSTATADPLLDLADVAAILGVSPQTARRMVNSGELPATRLGGKPHRPLRVSASALAERLNGWTTR